MTTTLAQVGALFTMPALAAAGAAAVSIPVIIHLLYRMRRRPEPWGAMRFLVLAYRRHRQRLRFEQWLLLLVRCLIVFVLGLALAGPMMTGCAALLGGGWDGRGREVHLVMDDALSTHAEQPGGERRVERLRDVAGRLADALGPADRVTLWRAGRPGELLLETETDRATLREAIEDFQPRYSRPDLPATLVAVGEALERTGAPAGSAELVVLSDFSRAAGYFDEPAPSALRGLGERANVWALRPAAMAENVQIASLRPRRPMQVADVLGSGEATVPVEVRLRRFDATLGAATVDVALTLLDGDGQSVGRVRRSHRFAKGQSEATLNVSLPVADGALPRDAEGGRVFVVRGRLDSGRLPNRLPADDERLAVVELRRQMNVALVDEPGERGAGGGLRPVQWLLLGLAPSDAADAGPIALDLLGPHNLSASALAEHDAALLVRPDLLSDEAWVELATFADRGGLVWVFAPAVDSTAVWAAAMQRAFDIDWRVAMESQAVADDEPGWSLASQARTPEALSLLAADWEALLSPVRVYRRLPMTAPRREQWLTLQADAEDAALMVGREHGRGTLLLLAAPLDSEWTNLPAKPLFVPMLHETLRGVLGEARGRIVADVVTGDRPALGPAWRDVDHLLRDPTFDPTELTATGDERVVLTAGEQAAEARRALAHPGVYNAPAEATALKLAVNVDADAGNTLPVGDDELARWLSALGPWQFLDDNDPGAALTREASSVNLGWPLLWLLLALVLAETFLARSFSHAYSGAPPTWGGDLRRMVRYARPSGRPTTTAAPREQVARPPTPREREPEEAQR